MNSIESIKTDELIEEYGEWLKMFTDDGYTLESFHQNGVTLTDARRERMERIARKYGAGIRNGQIVLESEGSRADAMNRYAQALLSVGSMMEAAQHKVAEYFADDVAAVLDECNVFYTASVGIRGVSKYEHSFDFIPNAPRRNLPHDGRKHRTVARKPRKLGEYVKNRISDMETRVGNCQRIFDNPKNVGNTRK